jgi:hypothetical protein
MQSNPHFIPNLALSIFVILYIAELIHVCLLNPHHPPKMTVTTTQSTIQTLTTLKHHYEQQLAQAEAESPASQHYADLLSHTDALLVGLLVQSNGYAAPTAPPEPVAKAAAQPQPKAKASTTKAKPEAAPAPRISFALLPAYQGKSKLEAIGTVLEKNQGEVVHHDSIIKELYGDLGPEALKVERLRMKASLRQGVKKKLWQKASAPSSYILEVVKAKASTPAEKGTPSTKGRKPKTLPKQSAQTPASVKKAPTAAKPSTSKKATPASKRTATRTSQTATAKAPHSKKTQPEIVSINGKMLGAKQVLTMHEDFVGLSKIDAVLKVMNENTGKVVNVDEIIERLYGQLSLADYKAEKARMKDVMHRGQGRELWRKAPAPLSFIVGEAEASKAKVSGRKATAQAKART